MNEMEVVELFKVAQLSEEQALRILKTSGGMFKDWTIDVNPHKKIVLGNAVLRYLLSVAKKQPRDFP